VDDPDYVRQFHHITPPRSAFFNRPGPLDEYAAALVQTNALGTRGPEPGLGPVDLLLIGDSMVEARQLPWEQTLGARLPASLAARSRTATVVSQGTRGWSPLLEWNWYLKVGRSLKPKTVLLFFFWNDLWPRRTETRTFRASARAMDGPITSTCRSIPAGSGTNTCGWCGLPRPRASSSISRCSAGRSPVSADQAMRWICRKPLKRPNE
jgi:hypothetical protein